MSLQTYQCRRCGLIFDEDDWRLNCRAPRPTPVQIETGRLMRRQNINAKPGSIASMDLLTDPDAPSLIKDGLATALRKQAARQAKEKEQK